MSDDLGNPDSDAADTGNEESHQSAGDLDERSPVGSGFLNDQPASNLPPAPRVGRLSEPVYDAQGNFLGYSSVRSRPIVLSYPADVLTAAQVMADVRRGLPVRTHASTEAMAKATPLIGEGEGTALTMEQFEALVVSLEQQDGPTDEDGQHSASTVLNDAARIIAAYRLSIPVDAQTLEDARHVMREAANRGAQHADLEAVVEWQMRRLQTEVPQRDYSAEEIATANERLDALDSDRQGLLANALDRAAQQRAAVVGLTERAPVNLPAGNPFIGEDFTIEEYEALLFDLEDYYRAQWGNPLPRVARSTSGTAVMPDAALGGRAKLRGQRAATEGRSWAPDSRDVSIEGYVGRVVGKAARRVEPAAEALGAWSAAQGVRVPGPATRRILWKRHRGKALAFAATAIALLIVLVTVGALLPALRGGVTQLGLFPTATNGNCTGCETVAPSSTPGASATATTACGTNCSVNPTAAPGGGRATPPPSAPTPTPKPGAKTITTPSDLRACDGCGNGDLRATAVSASATVGQGSYAADYHPGVAAKAGSLWIGIRCLFNVSVGCVVHQGTRVTASNGIQCSLDKDFFFDTTTGNQEVSTCSITVTGYLSWNFVGAGVSCGPCASASVYQQSVISNGTNGSAAYYTMPSTCASRGDPTGYARSQVLQRVGAPSAAPDTLGAPQASITGSVFCSTDANSCPQINGGATIGSSFTLCVKTSAQALYYRAQDAKDTQNRRLDALVPSGWQIASRSLCSVPTISGVDMAGKQAMMSCSASAVIQPV